MWISCSSSRLRLNPRWARFTKAHQSISIKSALLSKPVMSQDVLWCLVGLQSDSWTTKKSTYTVAGVVRINKRGHKLDLWGSAGVYVFVEVGYWCGRWYACSNNWSLLSYFPPQTSGGQRGGSNPLMYWFSWRQMKSAEVKSSFCKLGVTIITT